MPNALAKRSGAFVSRRSGGGGAVVQAFIVPVSGAPSTSDVKAALPLTDVFLSTSIDTSIGTKLLIDWFCAGVLVAGAGHAPIFNVYVDGNPYGNTMAVSTAGSGTLVAISGTAEVTGLAAGTHTVELRWAVSSGTMTVDPSHFGAGGGMHITETN